MAAADEAAAKLRSAYAEQAAACEALRQELRDSAEKLQGLEQRLADKMQEAVRACAGAAWRCWGLPAAACCCMGLPDDGRQWDLHPP
jgi:hypothetical protein